MRKQASTDAQAKAIVDAALRGELAEDQARRLNSLGSEVAKLGLLVAAKRIAELNNSNAEKDARIAELESRLKAAGQISPSTPSGQKPLYAKAPENTLFKLKSTLGDT